MACLGCQLANGLVDSKIVFENQYVACLLDIAPLNDGHTLIVPKRHLRELDELDEQTMRAVMNAAAAVSSAEADLRAGRHIGHAKWRRVQ